jgi:hypothetical protein
MTIIIQYCNFINLLCEVKYCPNLKINNYYKMLQYYIWFSEKMA